MILIGRYLSPFVRRTATVMHLLGLEFERKEVNTVDDAALIRQHNPLGRVPALIDDDQTLIDSHAIIDALLEDHADNALLARDKQARRHTLYTSAVAVGCMEKGVASAYEKSQRPDEYFYAPYRDKLREQVLAGLQHLDARLGPAAWFGGDAPDLGDVDAVVAYDFARIVMAGPLGEAELNQLSALSQRANDTEAFARTRWSG